MHFPDINWATLTATQAKRLAAQANKRADHYGALYNACGLEHDEAQCLALCDLAEDLTIFALTGDRPA